jgi:hypothetical protein
VMLKHSSGSYNITNTTAKTFNINTLTPIGSFAFKIYSDSGCATEITSKNVTVPASSTNANFYYNFEGGTSDANGNVTISHAYSPELLAPSSKNKWINVKEFPSTANRFAFSESSVVNLSTSECREFEIYTLDSSGTFSPVSGPKDFSIQWLTSAVGSPTAAPSGANIYTDGACGTPLSGNLTIATGSFKKSFYLKSTTSLTEKHIKVTSVSGPMNTWDGNQSSKVFFINPATVAHHVVMSATPDSNLTIGSTCREVSIQLKDNGGNDITVPTNKVFLFSLSSMVTGLNMYSDSGCTDSMGGMYNSYIPATIGTFTFYVKAVTGTPGPEEISLYSQFLEDHNPNSSNNILEFTLAL